MLHVQIPLDAILDHRTLFPRDQGLAVPAFFECERTIHRLGFHAAPRDLRIRGLVEGGAEQDILHTGAEDRCRRSHGNREAETKKKPIHVMSIIFGVHISWPSKQDVYILLTICRGEIH